MLIFIRLLRKTDLIKKGLSHEKTCDILDDMAHKDLLIQIFQRQLENVLEEPDAIYENRGCFRQ